MAKGERQGAGSTTLRGQWVAAEVAATGTATARTTTWLVLTRCGQLPMRRVWKLATRVARQYVKCRRHKGRSRNTTKGATIEVGNGQRFILTSVECYQLNLWSVPPPKGCTTLLSMFSLLLSHYLPFSLANPRHTHTRKGDLANIASVFASVDSFEAELSS